MNGILLLNEEGPSADDLRELIATSVRNIGKTQQDNLTKLNTKFEKQSSELSTLQQTLAEEENSLELKLDESTRASCYTKELELDKNALSAEVHLLESQKKDLKNTKPSKHDEETLERGRKKMDYYKQLSGITWDFGSLQETVKGFITNGKDHVLTFDFPNKENDSASKLEKQLWENVAKGTGSPVAESIISDRD